MSQPNDSRFVERDSEGNIIAVFACPQLSKDGKGFRTEAVPLTDETRADFVAFKERQEVRALRPIAPPIEEQK